MAGLYAWVCALELSDVGKDAHRFYGRYRRQEHRRPHQASTSLELHFVRVLMHRCVSTDRPGFAGENRRRKALGLPALCAITCVAAASLCACSLDVSPARSQVKGSEG